jgi:hypothetical protein
MVQLFSILIGPPKFSQSYKTPSHKLAKKKNSDHQIQQFYWPYHFFCTPTQKPIQHPLHIISILTSYYLGGFGTNYIILKNAEIFLVRENKEFFKILFFHNEIFKIY